MESNGNESGYVATLRQEMLDGMVESLTALEAVGVEMPVDMVTLQLQMIEKMCELTHNLIADVGSEDFLYPTPERLELMKYL